MGPRRFLIRLRAEARRRRRERGLRSAFETLRREADGRLPLRWEDRWLLAEDATSTTTFDRHYVYHVAWASRVIAANRPAKHVDVGSSLHFATMLSAFLPVEFYDYRPAELELDNLDLGPRRSHGAFVCCPEYFFVVVHAHCRTRAGRRSSFGAKKARRSTRSACRRSPASSSIVVRLPRLGRRRELPARGRDVAAAREPHGRR